jgi:hypothetical protein
LNNVVLPGHPIAEVYYITGRRNDDEDDFLEVKMLAVDIICFFAGSRNDVSTYVLEYLHHEWCVTVVKRC